MTVRDPESTPTTVGRAGVAAASSVNGSDGPSALDAIAAELQIVHGRSRLTLASVEEAVRCAAVTLMVLDTLVVLYDLGRIVRLL